MLAKIGFLLLILLFGGVMFLSGLMMPNELRNPVNQQAERVFEYLFSEVKTAVENKQELKKTPGEKASATVTVSYESLTRQPSPSEKGLKYAFQVGLYTDPDGAKPMSEKLASIGYEAKSIQTVDNNGVQWVVLAVGKYGTKAEAERKRPELMRNMKRSSPPILILLPEEPKKAA